MISSINVNAVARRAVCSSPEVLEIQYLHTGRQARAWERRLLGTGVLRTNDLHRPVGNEG